MWRGKAGLKAGLVPPKIGVFSLLHPTEGEMLTDPAGAAPAAEQMLLRTCEAGSGDVLS